MSVIVLCRMMLQTNDAVPGASGGTWLFNWEERSNKVDYSIDKTLMVSTCNMFICSLLNAFLIRVINPRAEPMVGQETRAQCLNHITSIIPSLLHALRHGDRSSNFASAKLWHL